MFLFGAYLDKRRFVRKDPLTEGHNAVIRILLTTPHPELKRLPFCHIWYKNSTNPTIVRAKADIYMWDPVWGFQKDGTEGHPHLLACPLPNENGNKVPVAVSLANMKCDKATNALTVIHDDPGKREGVAVCVKGISLLHAPDVFALRLAEWLEFLRAMGVGKVFTYVLNMSENGATADVLHYYAEDGLLSLSPLTLSGHYPNVAQFQNVFLRNRPGPKRLQEFIPYNDCLYRNLYR